MHRLQLSEWEFRALTGSLTWSQVCFGSSKLIDARDDLRFRVIFYMQIKQSIGFRDSTFEFTMESGAVLKH